MNIYAIGVVKNEAKQRGREEWEKVISEIWIEKRLEEALEGLEHFSHIIVISWMHQIPPEERSILKVHPRRRLDLPLVGVLATRSPARPNPLALAVVPLLERRGSVLKVKGLDALDGTPVLDIKPYLPHSDSVANARIPEWVNRALGKGPAGEG